jgi:hypothetical protein
LFSGRILHHQNNHTHLQNNIIKNNTADFYLCYSNNDEKTINNIDRFKELYNPVIAIMNEDTPNENEYRHYNKPPCITRFNVLCMHYNRKKIWNEIKKLTENSELKYDMYISTRLDIRIEEDLKYEYFSDMSDNKIYIPEGYDNGGINDQTAIGNYNSIQTYMGVFDDLHYLLSNGVQLHLEWILLEYLKMKKMTIIRFPLKCRIVR